VASERQPASDDLADRLAAARRDVEANVQRLQHTRSQLMATRERLTAGRAEREILHESAFARLAARLDSQPVIEQAKGILIAQVGCTPDEAFTMLRAASQRTNVRIRDLARDIVERTASRKQSDGKPRQVVRQSSADHHGG
jgi:hypothetical protein